MILFGVIFLIYFTIAAFFFGFRSLFRIPLKVVSKLLGVLPILGDVFFGIGISALANKFEIFVDANMGAIGEDSYVILSALAFIIMGSVMKELKDKS